MDNTLDKLKTGVTLALDGASSIDEVASRISALKEQGMLPSSGQVDDLVEFLGAVEKQDPKSKLKIRANNADLMSASYRFLHGLTRKYMDPSDPNFLIRNVDWNDPYVDYYLDEIWKREPILSGAVYSMSAKMSALEWTITGGKSVAKKYARMFSSAAHMGGYSWDGFISSTCQDFYAANRGVFWETARRGDDPDGRLSDLGHIDSLACTLTGNTQYPVWYMSEVTGQSIRFKPGEFIHFASMPSARENRLGSGFCAVARALNAAQMIIRLHDYDMEKMNNLPPEGVAAVTGMTYEELADAFTLWQTERKSNSSLTYPQVLWLLSSTPGAEVRVDIQSFSQLPESFERDVVIEQYVNLIALVFGVDAREFWPISTSSLGTAAESEIQHLKAKGKGHGEFISIAERHINGELEDGVDFAFDTQDIDEDLKSAAVAKAWIDAYLPLIGQGAGGKQPAAGATSGMEEPMPGQPQGGSSPANGVEIITKDQLKRLLADKGVLPDYMVLDDRIAIRDSDVHMKDLYYDDEYDRYPEDISCFRWKDGVIRRERVPGITLWTKPNGNPLPAEVMKGGPGSGYFGHAGRPGSVGGSNSNNTVSYADLREVQDEYSGEASDMVHEYAMGNLAKKNLVSVLRRETDAQMRLQENLRKIADDNGYVTVYRGGEELKGNWSNATLRKDIAHTYASGFTGMDDIGSITEYKVPIDNFIGIGNIGEYEVFFTRNKKVVVVQKEDKQKDLIELPKRNIRGNPIPEKEATRGTMPTKTTIKDENERWRNNEVLAKYAITDEEIDELKLPEAKLLFRNNKK